MMFLPFRDASPRGCVNSDTFYLLDTALFMPNIISTAEISVACSPCNLDVPRNISIYFHFCRKVKGNVRDFLLSFRIKRSEKLSLSLLTKMIEGEVHCHVMIL